MYIDKAEQQCYFKCACMHNSDHICKTTWSGKLHSNKSNIGSFVKQARVRAGLSRAQLGAMSMVSASYLARVENGQRFPSAKILRKLAPHLNVDEMELLVLAKYVTAGHNGISVAPRHWELDPHVAELLSMETVEMQRAVIGILYMVKYVAEGLACEEATVREKKHLSDTNLKG